jgi:hypothetical protein
VVTDVRQVPTAATITTDDPVSLTFRISFNESVTGVDISDFFLTKTGTADGTIASVTPVSAGVYDVVVSGAIGNGTLRLDLKNSGTGIQDSVANNIVGGYTGGEIYTIEPVPAPTSDDENIKNVTTQDLVVYAGPISGGSDATSISAGSTSILDLIDDSISIDSMGIGGLFTLYFSTGGFYNPDDPSDQLGTVIGTQNVANGTTNTLTYDRATFTHITIVQD